MSMRQSTLSQDRLRELIRYFPETGKFLRLGNRRSGYMTRPTGWTDSMGYTRIYVDGMTYKASWLAWLYVYGELPKNELDHINGIRDDDRIENLRDGTRAENCQNQKRAHRNNQSGRLGVHIRHDGPHAVITVDGRQTDLGLFSTIDEAAEVYLTEKRKRHLFGTI